MDTPDHHSDTDSTAASFTRASGFHTTHWSLVLQAGREESPDAAAALERLCRFYWSPIYVYVRRQGYSPHDAQDLTQEFFARLLRLRSLAAAAPEKGRFRSFLLTSLKHFLVSEWRKTVRQKRGGGQAVLSWDAREAEEGLAAEPASETTPESAYERAWALTLMEHVLGLLRDEYTAVGKGALFDQLKRFVWSGGGPATYAGVAVQLGLSEGAVKVGVHRLRQRCRERLRAEVAQTVARPEEIDEELRHLVAVFGT